MTASTRIHDLELIVALSEERNLSQAARRIGLTQPAITKRLRVIERSLQLKLFETNHRGTSPTDAGRLFAAHAQQTINLFHRGIHEARQARQTQTSRLRVGVSPFQSPILVEMLRSLELRLYRNLVLEIESAFSCDLTNKLQSHEIDVALVTSPPPSHSITTTVLCSRRFMIVFDEKHPLASQPTVSLSESAAFPWVFFSRCVHPYLHDQILRRANTLHLEPQITHRIMYPEEARALLGDGATIAWLGPTGASRIARVGSLAARPLVDKEVQLEIHLATWATNDSPLVSEFIRTFMSRYQQVKQPVQMVLPIATDKVELVS
jgi:DNA-binding transcriptional LysR family regulator